MSVVAVGAPGGAGNCGSVAGGVGGELSGDVPVTPGQVLFVEVGGPGAAGYNSCTGAPGGTGGFNGGGDAGVLNYDDGGGGGASDVRTVSSGSPCNELTPASLGSRLLVAGGGGGGGATSPGSGGGGAAGQPGEQGASPGGGGGGAGTLAGGGIGGAANTTGGCTSTPTGGVAGMLGAGGTGGANGYGGAGGGGGYYGGGGGGAACFSAGGGGGGASFASIVVSGAVEGLAPGTSTPPSVTITPLYAAAQVTPASLTFPSQPVGTVSGPQTVTITDATGAAAPLTVTGYSFLGADADDFFIGSTTCGGQLLPGQSCEVTVRFAPAGQGARTAALQIASNDPNGPASVSTSGTGAAGPQGPAGATGPQGPAGATGPQGPAGRVELMTCKTITKTVLRRHRRVPVERQQCTGRLLSGKINFTIAGAVDDAAISRGRTVYATGVGVSIGNGHLQLLLADRRTLRRGRYTLTLHQPHQRRSAPRRVQITIG